MWKMHMDFDSKHSLRATLNTYWMASLSVAHIRTHWKWSTQIRMIRSKIEPKWANDFRFSNFGFKISIPATIRLYSFTSFWQYCSHRFAFKIGQICPEPEQWLSFHLPSRFSFRFLLTKSEVPQFFFATIHFNEAGPRCRWRYSVTAWSRQLPTAFCSWK